MAGLIEEIQAKVLDSSINTTALLRMVKLAASKLQLSDAVEWVDHELKGYPSADDTPDYRRTRGQLKARNPMRGPIPVDGDPEIIRILSEQFVTEPISHIEALCTSDNGTIHHIIDHSVSSKLAKQSGTFHMPMFVEVPVAFFIDIQEQVRNLILEWALGLEQAGIYGEGVSFSVEEKAKAAQHAPSIINNNYGHIHHGDVTGNQNRVNLRSTDSSHNSVEVQQPLEGLLQSIEDKVENQNDRSDLIEIVKILRETQGTQGYTPAFQRLVEYASQYVTIISPFIPALSKLLA